MQLLALIFLHVLVHICDASSPCTVQCPSCENSSLILGYYWRDYFGKVPADALPGGFDEQGDVTYIGQAYFKQYELLPGTLYRRCPKIRTNAYDIIELTTNRNIKILCTNVAYKFKWKLTKKGRLNELTNCHLVIGGSEIGVDVYIGRTNYKGQTIIGKVFYGQGYDTGLAISGTNDRFDDFEILTYNC